VHESLFLYFKECIKSNKSYQKQIASYIFSKPFEFTKQLSQLEIGRLALWIKDTVKSKDCFASTVELLLSISNFQNVNVNFEIYDYLYDIYDLYKREKGNTELLKKIINARIYITLHYLTPINAVKECDDGLMRLESSILSSDEILKNEILAQKAHSLLSAGQRVAGELVLKELLAKSLLVPLSFDINTRFNLFDRLSAVYMKSNCQELSLSYSDIAMSEAKKFKDNSLTILAHRSRSKLFFYNNPEQCKWHLDQADELSKNGAYNRINLDNLLSEFIFEMTHEKQCNWKKIMNHTLNAKDNAIKNELNKSIVRAYMILAVCNLKLASDKSSLLATKELFIDKGINASFYLGIPSHIWQLYNLLAIVEDKLNESSDQAFETVFAYLAKQNLLHIGNRDFCFSNIMAISNIGYFLRRNDFESEFMSKMSKVTYIDYSQLHNIKSNYIDNDYLEKQYEKARKEKNKSLPLLFIDKTPSYILRDEETQYFIPMS
jgi:hypothetical protein